MSVIHNIEGATHLTPFGIVLFSIFTWPVFLLFLWSRWRGLWRVIASVPLLVTIGGCIYYIMKNSNTWPFWIVIVAPYNIAFLLLLWGAHFLVVVNKRTGGANH